MPHNSGVSVGSDLVTIPMTPRVVQHGNYFSADLAGSDKTNTRLLAALHRQIEAGNMRGSHFFNGRYENLYLNKTSIPEIKPILRFARQSAGLVLHTQKERLCCGFWFNLMHSGEVTGRHSHDDDDELLSAVYYVKVPAGSGELVFYNDGTRTAVTPVAGRLILFTPALEHEVVSSNFAGERVAIGMNFGMAYRGQG